MGEAAVKAKNKEEKFFSNPEKFIDIDDLIIGAFQKNGPDGAPGIAFHVSAEAHINRVKQVIFDLNLHVQMLVMQFNVMRQKEEKSPLIVPK